MKYFCFFLLWSLPHFAQNIEWEKKSESPVRYDLFWGTDISGHTYFSSNTNLYKITDKDTLNYTNNKFGKISGVETFNLLQTIVFYKQNNAFVLLDAQFNEIRTTIFSELNCELLKPASQNELWFYDSLTQRIGLYNLNSNTSKLLSNPIFKSIAYSHSDYNYLYWLDTENDLFSINKFGKVTSFGKIHPFDSVTFSDKSELYYLFEGEIYFYSFENQQSTKINLPEKMIKNFFYKDGILSIFTNNLLRTYQIKK